MAKHKRRASPSDEAERIVCRNRRAAYNFELLDRFEAGIALVGSEVKSIRAGRASVAEAHVELVEGEAWLVGAHIAEYPWAGRFNHEPTRRRKLLLRRAEIDKLSTRVRDKGMTLVPLCMYFRGGRVKLELALAKGKKRFDKREDIKARDVERDHARYR